jgi:transcriptional regulator with XRE-family HTH domain
MSTMKREITERDRNIGKAVRHYRKHRKLTIRAVAEELGITAQQMRKYEVGMNRISAGRLSVVADILGVPVESFFNPHVTPDAHDDPTDELLDVLYRIEAYWADVPDITNKERCNGVIHSVLVQLDGCGDLPGFELRTRGGDSVAPMLHELYNQPREEKQ